MVTKGKMEFVPAQGQGRRRGGAHLQEDHGQRRRRAGEKAEAQEPARASREVVEMTLAYYPGCSLRHSSAEFDVSTRKVLEVLGVESRRCPTGPAAAPRPAHMMDHLLAQSLAARNLRQAAQVGDEMLAPCPSCYQREKNAEVEIHESDAFRAEVNEMLDKPYTGSVHGLRRCPSTS